MLAPVASCRSAVLVPPTRSLRYSYRPFSFLPAMSSGRWADEADSWEQASGLKPPPKNQRRTRILRILLRNRFSKFSCFFVEFVYHQEQMANPAPNPDYSPTPSPSRDYAPGQGASAQVPVVASPFDPVTRMDTSGASPPCEWLGGTPDANPLDTQGASAQQGPAPLPPPAGQPPAQQQGVPPPPPTAGASAQHLTPALALPPNYRGERVVSQVLPKT